MLYIYVLSTGDMFITTSPTRKCSVCEKSDEDTLTLEETGDTWFSPEEIDQKIDNYFDQQGDNDEWIEYS